MNIKVLKNVSSTIKLNKFEPHVASKTRNWLMIPKSANDVYIASINYLRGASEQIQRLIDVLIAEWMSIANIHFREYH